MIKSALVLAFLINAIAVKKSFMMPPQPFLDPQMMMMGGGSPFYQGMPFMGGFPYQQSYGPTQYMMPTQTTSTPLHVHHHTHEVARVIRHVIKPIDDDEDEDTVSPQRGPRPLRLRSEEELAPTVAPLKKEIDIVMDGQNCPLLPRDLKSESCGSEGEVNHEIIWKFASICHNQQNSKCGSVCQMLSKTASVAASPKTTTRMRIDIEFSTSHASSDAALAKDHYASIQQAVSSVFTDHLKNKKSKMDSGILNHEAQESQYIASEATGDTLYLSVYNDKQAEVIFRTSATSAGLDGVVDQLLDVMQMLKKGQINIKMEQATVSFVGGPEKGERTVLHSGAEFIKFAMCKHNKLNELMRRPIGV